MFDIFEAMLERLPQVGDRHVVLQIDELALLGGARSR